MASVIEGVVEELYDVQADPNCLVNLIGSAKHEQVADELRMQLLEHMRSSEDPLAAILEQKDDPERLQQYMDEAQAEADLRRKRKRSRQSRPQMNSGRKPKGSEKFFSWKVNLKSKGISVSIDYKLPAGTKQIPLIVTLKSAKNERLQRQQVSIKGEGTARIEFDLPIDQDAASLKLAAYIGRDYQSNWQYENATVSSLIE